MLEIKVTVEIPDLLKAVQMFGVSVKDTTTDLRKDLAELLKDLQGKQIAPYTAPDMPVFTAPDPNPVTPVAAMPAEQQAVAATTTAPVTTNPAPAITPAPTPVTPPTVAPTAAPAFTLAQVSRAGAELLTAQPSLQPKLVELIGRFGGQSVKDIPAERLGEFAAELRKMGANI